MDDYIPYVITSLSLNNEILSHHQEGFSFKEYSYRVFAEHQLNQHKYKFLFWEE